MGGATPTRWIKEAEGLTPSGTSGAMSGKGGPRATLHCTVSSPTQFNDMHRVLTGKQAEPHLLYSFADDRLGQYFALDRSARALMGSARTPSGISHNRVGTVNIQIEVVGTTDDWTARPDWRPGPNFRAMMAAIASWGIRPEFIYRPATTAADRANVVRSFATMVGDAGGGKWWGHCHYPDGESHWDPGRVNLPRFFAAAYGTTTAPAPQEDFMASIDDLMNYPMGSNPLDGKTPSDFQNSVEIARNYAFQAWDVAIKVRDRLDDLAAAVAQLASPDVDEAALAAALAGPLADAIASKLPESALTSADVEQAIRSVLGSVDNTPTP